MPQEFFTDADQAAAQLCRYQRQYSQRLNDFADVAAHWRQLSTSRLRSVITFDSDVVAGGVESGNIMGLPFRITAEPCVIGDGICARLTISTTDFAGKQQKRAVFLYGDDSSVLADDGTVVVGPTATYPNYLWLCNLIATVLRKG